MQISQTRRRIVGSFVEISALFSFRNPKLDQRVWFRIPKKYAGSHIPNDAFLVAAAPLALALDEELFVRIKISKILAENLPKISKPIGLEDRKLQLHHNSTEYASGSENRGKGLFFTLGVDSFHSLIDNLKFPLKKRIKYLIFIKGLELYPISKSKMIEMEARFKLTAKKTKTKLIFVETNLRTLSDRILNWEYYHGAALAAAGHTLSKIIETIYISSGDDYLLSVPWGTNKVLDQLWSSESIKFKSSGSTLSKYDKIKDISRSSLRSHILKSLWVCWEGSDDERLTNCSVCEKCLRVHLTFKAVGLKQTIPVFKPLTTEAVSRLKVLENCLTTWNKTYHGLKKNRQIDPEIVDLLGKKIKLVKRYKIARLIVEIVEKKLIDRFKLHIKRHLRNELFSDLRLIFRKKTNLLQ